jgi:hypothetical protein
MECAEIRKKLKEYANDEINSKEDLLKMETHIGRCEVCKRELLLWQEVMDKQRAVGGMQAGMPKELKDRIKYKMAGNQKHAAMAPMAKKFKALAGKGTLIAVFVLICIVLIFILRSSNLKHSIIGPILIFSGFAILFLLVLFRGPKKP